MRPSARSSQCSSTLDSAGLGSVAFVIVARSGIALGWLSETNFSSGYSVSMGNEILTEGFSVSRYRLYCFGELGFWFCFFMVCPSGRGGGDAAGRFPLLIFSLLA